MAKCGIKIYDNMPSVVDGVDVDAIRASLSSDRWFQNLFMRLHRFFEIRAEPKYRKLDECLRISIKTKAALKDSRKYMGW